MKYTIDKQEKYSLLSLHEEKMDSNIAPDLKSQMITLHAEGVKNIILDLANVKYTDSSGLSALLVGNRIFQEDGGIFVLSNLSEHTLKLIKISQLDSVLHILPSVEEAIDTVFMHEIEKDMKDEGS
ncbi:MAG: STAS domain-containing protein [Cyclobacteriaceae bacterium]|nr:STAS domain-containing protein [Cyclobacteriaceae bacterium]MCB0500784.1 STAS domain-containing protein [Cyclobacteriaceae bacterium]MCB9236681.1 STAS domain-containing protein [Flammeovirgaceae bacterium]MCO5272602.1 STAS domain-containing protein [Cyclobacteriaceae bacterium]MCW5901960.1 STAS domain-containing protein [Cyclobacteriaceae bacterium]